MPLLLRCITALTAQMRPRLKTWSRGSEYRHFRRMTNHAPRRMWHLKVMIGELRIQPTLARPTSGRGQDCFPPTSRLAGSSLHLRPPRPRQLFQPSPRARPEMAVAHGDVDEDRIEFVLVQQNQFVAKFMRFAIEQPAVPMSVHLIRGGARRHRHRDPERTQGDTQRTASIGGPKCHRPAHACGCLQDAGDRLS